MLHRYGAITALYINSVIYSEVSIGFIRIEEAEEAINGCGFQMIAIPKEALFLAGKAFLQYKKRRERKSLPLPDFFIGAHAAVDNLRLMTRDPRRIRTYFPGVEIICPEGQLGDMTHPSFGRPFVSLRKKTECKP